MSKFLPPSNQDGNNRIELDNNLSIQGNGSKIIIDRNGSGYTTVEMA